VLDDETGSDLVGYDRIERPVIGFRVDASEVGATDIGDMRAELVAEQPEDAEDHIGISPSVTVFLDGTHIPRFPGIKAESSMIPCGASGTSLNTKHTRHTHQR